MNYNVNRRIHSRAIEIKEGFIPFNRSASCKRIRKHDQNLDSSRFSSGRATWNEMNSRTQWGSFSAVNTELLKRELVTRWISAPNGVHSTKPIKNSPEHGNIDADCFSAVEMNSRGQWVSFSYIFGIPSPEWIPALNGVHCRARLTTQPSLATQCRQMYPWEEMNSRVQWGSFSFNNVCSGKI